MPDDLREQLQLSLGAGFTLERELVGGGMSRVFLAEDRAFARQVVIKVLPPELAGAVSIRRFEREIALAARLQHAHIVPVHAAGDCDGLPFYVMPFVEGDSLRMHLARHGELPIGDAVRMLREIASALAYAHEHGVVHRDIKPDNILLSGEATMVTDFGVARALESSTLGDRPSPPEGGLAPSPTPAPSLASGLGLALGTPAYMAPEQAAADGSLDHRADIYSFGVLAYEALSGQAPFAGRSAQHLLAAHLNERPVPLGQRRPAVPPVLSALVMQCLEKRPADRPQSATGIVRALDAMGAVSSPQAPHGTIGPATMARRWAWPAATVLLGATAFALWGRGAPERPRLAILPFENLGAPADEYFADGVTDEVSNRLAAVAGLGVVGRASAQRYKRTTASMRQVARELGVHYLVTGTVRWERSGEGVSRVRVTPQVIRASDESSLWTRTYEGPLSSVFTFQTWVAESVAAAMNVRLARGERRRLSSAPTANLDAYDAYLRGVSTSGRGSLFDPAARQAAIGHFRRAVDLDPSFVAAHARLALAWINDERFGNNALALDSARGHLASALRLDSTSIETRIAQGWYLLERGEPRRALEAVEALLREAPANSRGLYLAGVVEDELDRPGAAIARFADAEILEPLDPDPPAALAGLYDGIGRHAEAVRAREHELTIVADNVETYYAQAASHLLWRYDTSEARRVLERGIAAVGLARMARLPRSWVLDWTQVLPPPLSTALDTTSRAPAGGTSRLLVEEGRLRYFLLSGQHGRARAIAGLLVQALEPVRATGDPDARLLLGVAYATLGRAHEAQQEAEAAASVLARVSGVRRRVPGLLIAAWIEMATGRRERTLDLLEAMAKARSGFYVSGAVLRLDPLWAPIRSHPRFEGVAAAFE